MRPPYQKFTEWIERQAILALPQHGPIHENGVFGVTKAGSLLKQLQSHNISWR
jgi:hypothetical protein